MGNSSMTFITFEGGEGAGKTTLIEHVARQLTSEGRVVLKTREPGGTPLGEKIRALLLEHSSHLFCHRALPLFSFSSSACF